MARLYNKPTEDNFQKAFEKGLLSRGYIDRESKDFDRGTCLDREIFIRYIKDTQKPVINSISRQFKDKTPDQIENFIIDEYIRSVDEKGLSYVLKKGFDVADDPAFHIDVTYERPSLYANPAQLARYQKNIYSFIPQCIISGDGKDIVDLCVFRNGILYVMFELKYTKSAQDYTCAIKQWKTERDSHSRAMQPDKGCLVWFAQDEDDVFFSTDVADSEFLPFNQGSNKSGELIEIGAGNDLREGSLYKTSYMYEDILLPATWDYIVDNMLLSQVRDIPTFPRYHQYSTVRAIDDIVDPLVEEPRAGQVTFLTQQAPGAGKTLEIAWASILLANKATSEDKALYDKVVILTNRIVAVRNIADELVKSGELAPGYVAYAERDSASLLDAIRSKTRIIITSAQKFLHKGDEIARYNAERDVRYAVFIDEAHDNTEGKNQLEIQDALLGQIYDKVAEKGDRYVSESHIDLFTFTATPKPETLKLFGREAENGTYLPHTVYSMKQAIEEGFIIDVLDNVYTLETYHRAEKAIEDDPVYQSKKAKNALQRLADSSWEFIREIRIPFIVGHFMGAVDGHLLGGKEKALVVCDGIENAINYRRAFDEFCQENGYDIPTMLAFSGTFPVDGRKESEHSLNPEVKGDIGEAFKRTEGEGVPRVMFVANKYQQAYDLPELCALYVCKHIGSSITLVQLYGRPNRVAFAPDGTKKKTIIVDFANRWEEDICESFRPYYSTFGKQPASSRDAREIMEDICESGIIDSTLLRFFADWVRKAKSGASQKELENIQAMFDIPIDSAYERLVSLDSGSQQEIKKSINEYHRAYMFKRLTRSGEYDEDEEVFDYFLGALSNKVSGKGSHKEKENGIPVNEVEFVSHKQIVTDSITNGVHLDGSDASMEAWLDARAEELSVEPVDEQDWNARREEKESKAEAEREEFLSVIVEEYNLSNEDVPVEAGTIGLIMDRIVETLAEDGELRQAALSNDIGDYRAQYYSKAKEFSHSIPLEMERGEEIDLDDVLFFDGLWINRQEDVTRLMGFHCDTVFYKLRREAFAQ